MKKLVTLSILAVMAIMVFATPVMASSSQCATPQAVQTQYSNACTPSTQGKTPAGQFTMTDFKAFLGQFNNSAPTANGIACPRF